MQIQKIVNKFKELKGFSVLIIPDDTARESRTYKLSPGKLYSLAIGYTVLAMLFGFVLLNITPFGLMIFPKYANLSSDDLKKIDMLNTRMLQLNRELESIRSTNKRLQNAIMLGDSTILDSINNSNKKPEIKKEQIEGSVISLLRILFPQEKNKENNLYFYPPANGFISRPFNPDKGHMGTDYVLKTGTPIFASANGYVVFSGFTSKDGYSLIISHPGEYVTVYKHCSVLLKKNREEVIQGEIIALSGNSGQITTGPHLHFEIWKDGFPVDPEKYLLKY